MNSHCTLALCAALTSAFVTACSGNPEDADPRVGTATERAENGNGMTPDAISGEGLLPPAVLGASPLSFGSLAPAAAAALQDTTVAGDVARQLVEYATSCALDPSQSFDFSWTDDDGNTWDESYPGLLGLATDWTGQALSSDEQAWVSACLISRVNYLGVTVELSSRGLFPGLTSPPASEVQAFPMQEGAFFGDLFTSTPTAYACDDVADDANSQAMDRFCAAGYVDASGHVDSCGIIQRLGSCSDYCALSGNGEFYWLCGTEPLDQGWQGLTIAAMTVFLQ